MYMSVVSHVVAGYGVLLKNSLMKGMDEGFNILSRYLIYLRMKNLRGEGMDFPAASLDDFLSRDKEDTE